MYNEQVNLIKKTPLNLALNIEFVKMVFKKQQIHSQVVSYRKHVIRVVIVSTLFMDKRLCNYSNLYKLDTNPIVFD